jgi:hypothetical protein
MKKVNIRKTKVWERTSDWLFPLVFFFAWTYVTGTWFS